LHIGFDLKFGTYQSESPNKIEHISSRAYRLLGQGLGLLVDVVNHAITVGSWVYNINVDTYARGYINYVTIAKAYYITP